MRKVLFLIAGCVAMLFSSVQLSAGAEIGQGLTSQEVRNLFSNKTFLVTQVARKTTRGNKKERDFYCYFSTDGKFAFQENDGNTTRKKSGLWNVGGRGELCFIFSRNSSRKKRIVTRCGILIKRGPYSYDRINDAGEHTATITLIANGNKFPKK